MSGFQFVQFEGPNDSTKPRKQQIVRAHAMKNYHQRRKRANRRYLARQIHEEPQTADVDPKRRSGIRPESATCLQEAKSKDSGQTLLMTRTGVAWEEYAIDWPGGRTHGARYDPDNGNESGMVRFDLPNPRLALTMFTQAPCTHMLLNQHVANIEAGYATLSFTSRDSPMTTHWLPASRMHPMLFHASLFVCSSSFETLCQKPLSSMSYKHRGIAIQMINDGLSDPTERRRDEIVAAILSLSNFECVVGNMSALNSHLSGLRELAELRGELTELGMDGLSTLLMELFTWFLDVFSFPGTDRSNRLQSSPPTLPTFFQLFTLSDSVIIVPPDGHRPITPLQDIYDSLARSDDSPFPQAPFTGELPSEFEILSENRDYVYESCRIAYLIWCARWDDCSWKSTSFLPRFLKECIEKTNLGEYWLPIPGALLWCLLVGVDSTFGDAVLYPWFASQLLRFWVPLGLERWHSLRRTLECFGWLLKYGPSRDGRWKSGGESSVRSNMSGNGGTPRCDLGTI